MADLPCDYFNVNENAVHVHFGVEQLVSGRQDLKELDTIF